MPVLAAISFSHHMTAYVTAAMIAGVVVLYVCREILPFGTKFSVLGAGVIFCVVTVAWSKYIGGTDSYLGPLIDTAAAELTRMLSFSGEARVPFEAADGTRPPLWIRILSISGLLMVAAGICFGFLRAMRHAGVTLRFADLRLSISPAGWQTTWLRLMVLITILWPVSVVLRLTTDGWEVGNRMAPFAFLGVGIVIAIGVASEPVRRRLGRQFAVVVGLAAAVLIVSTIINSSGGTMLPRRGYLVAADAELDGAGWHKSRGVDA